jgi:hypothetical protein
MGWAWSADNKPLPEALVRLRNIVSGRVEAAATATADGEFTFTDVEGGSYVVELVDEEGRVRAVGQVFTIQPGETVATFVRLGAHLPWFTGLFSNTAAAVVSSAAGLGITAVAPVGRALSAEG